MERDVVSWHRFVHHELQNGLECIAVIVAVYPRQCPDDPMECILVRSEENNVWMSHYQIDHFLEISNFLKQHELGLITRCIRVYAVQCHHVIDDEIEQNQWMLDAFVC